MRCGLNTLCQLKSSILHLPLVPTKKPLLYVLSVTSTFKTVAYMIFKEHYYIKLKAVGSTHDHFILLTIYEPGM